jgi:hypothetical protein
MCQNPSAAADWRHEGGDTMRKIHLVALVIGFAMLGNVARAHHSQAGIFESTRTIEVTGVIKSVSWRNPHGQILLAVRDQAGKETVWDAETASISILRNRGADGSSIRVRDRVTIAGSPSAARLDSPNGTRATTCC